MSVRTAVLALALSLAACGGADNAAEMENAKGIVTQVCSAGAGNSPTECQCFAEALSTHLDNDVFVTMAHTWNGEEALARAAYGRARQKRDNSTIQLDLSALNGAFAACGPRVATFANYPERFEADTVLREAAQRFQWD